MGERVVRTGRWLGLLRRPGEPAPVFTPREQRLMGAVLLLGLALLLLALALTASGRSIAGWVAMVSGLALTVGLNVVVRRLRRRRGGGA